MAAEIIPSGIISPLFSLPPVPGDLETSAADTPSEEGSVRGDISPPVALSVGVAIVS